MSSSEKKHAAWVDVVAGGCGGALAKSLLSPFQRIVVLQQLGQHKSYSIRKLAQHIYHQDGLKGFWRGNLTSMVIRVPYSGIQFLLYSQCKFVLQDWLDSRRKQRAAEHAADTDGSEKSVMESRNVELIEKFILKCGAGGISATVAGAAVYPGEVVRLRLMSGEKEFTGIAHTCRLVYRETNSLRNFYRGLGASLMQRVPDILVSFATYETIKYAVLDSPNPPFFKDNFTARNLLATILGGSAAAIASILVAFPLDVAKRRIGMSGKSTDKVVYKGVADCLGKIYAKEGIRGWYSGSFVEAVRCVPQVILMWIFIESIQKHLSPYAAVGAEDSKAEEKK
ncbi:putative mitochondrial mitochondrial carrier protein [Leptomonas pyrrhocoris]|uniref:Putative mitochondrial mitochondrial carrier protein n=1 Tax=Leptomonas pyrrhocoris TaxID=157538 RepID=A0A0M9G5Y5_LEPPY|nr:putative mitochondrial mitochondrial carrier protein [Leptomonas pyrrhocoris]KPA82879.1 putative mitochondrial mitochondrial carrier protein [Leptomonas pyrrhocoris]|eukprot:XP_015661318.1 putative mitochondrial mitochondrial carrier protein [Leptomonas pyrrhocoris]